MITADNLKTYLQEAAAVLKSALSGETPVAGIILGSGLGALADHIENPTIVPFADIPHMRTSTATSHKARFVIGTLNGKKILAMQGRLHGYEGYSAPDVAFPVWLMHELGINTLITTNAAGAINPTYQPGEFCIMSDQINFTGRNPIAGLGNETLALRFFSMKDAFAPELRSLAKDCAQQENVAVQEGVYLGLLGPSFETPAEIEAFSHWGADTVAMSVVEEVIAARYVGMRVLGISLLSNMACGVRDASPTEDEVFEVAQTAEPAFIRLITAIVGQM